MRKIKLMVLVLDTYVFIDRIRLDKLAERFTTTEEVLLECKTNYSSLCTHFLDFRVIASNPSEVTIKEVTTSASFLANYHKLSSVDIGIIALALTFETAAHGRGHIRNNTVKFKVNSPNGNLVPKNCLVTKSEVEVSSSSFPRKTNNNLASNYWKVARCTRAHRKSQRKNYFESKEFDYSQTFEINPMCDFGRSFAKKETSDRKKKEKIHQKYCGQNKIMSCFNVKMDFQSLIGCFTSDFVMQNVILDLGLQLVCKSERIIKEYNRY